MNYPQLTGEPNFVLIGVSGIFGLLVIIMIYYIFISKNSRGSGGSTRNSSNLQTSQLLGSTSVTNPNITSANGLPSPVVNGGYYAPAPAATPAATVSSTPQVFNIKNNIYTYDDSASVCGVYNAEVATIDQLIAAHKGGADWCNVGWTKDGLAAYPIQYSTWKTLQDNVPDKRGMCGSPGINLARNDPNLLYGVNCYGVKPEPKKGEKVKEVVQSDADVALAAKIAQFQRNINNITVVPFNANTWSV
jgi:hypothetical protein